MRRRAQGAEPLEGGRCSFRTWAPQARNLSVVLASGRSVELAGDDNGYFGAVVDGVRPGSTYRYVIDGGEPLPDPASRAQPGGVHGPSAVVDSSSFPWTDDGWAGMPLQDYIIMEAHVGTFTPEGTFDAMIAHLDDMHDLGITALEVMPIAQFPGARNWGYDGVFPYAAQNTYGGPEGLMRLVDACHARGIAFILDVVYNHLGPEGNRLGDFGPYFTELYRTPWGAAMNVDGPYSDEVRRFFIDNALMWLEDFHVDALRLDAVHGIFDMSAYPFLRQLGDVVHERARDAGRPFHLIAESDSSDPRIVTPSEDNGIGMDAQWSDDLHHAVHTLLTGELDGYYADYGSLEHLARAFDTGFLFRGNYSVYRKRTHGVPGARVPLDRLVVCAQNHDQVGNRMRGERLSTLVDHRRLRLAAGCILLPPSIPMLFAGEEYGETAPFQYFIDHTDPDLVEAVRSGRAEEFAAFEWNDPPDPADEKTFRASKLDRGLRSQPENRALLDLHRELIMLRSSLHGPVSARADEGSRTVQMTRGDVDVVFNFGDAPARAHFEAGVELLLCSDDDRFGGPRETAIDGASLTIGSWAFAIVRRRSR